MTPLARRLFPLAVLLSGVIAAAAVVLFAARAQQADRDENDRRAVQLVSVALEARMDALQRALRGPSAAFDLGALEPRYLSGVLRLAYAQSGEIAAVTLLDHDGSAIVPAVFLARAGALGGPGRASESLEDLDRFAHQIPFAQALARGRALAGPYLTVRGDGTRVAMASAVPVADGTRTWVLAAEIDVDHVLDGLAAALPEASALVATRDAVVGRSPRVPEELVARVRGRLATGTPREPETLTGRSYRAVLSRAPAGLDGALVLVWPVEAETLRRFRLRETALGVIVVSIVGALAAALAVGLRDAPAPERLASDSREGDALGAVVKELANPIAANTAAAQLLAQEPGNARIAETAQRSAMRVERVFRRVARLARSGQESARSGVDLAGVVRREAESARAEVEASGRSLALDVPQGEATVRGDADDLALLTQVLIDAARTVAPDGGVIDVTVSRNQEPAGVEVRVRDGGAFPVNERRALTELAESTRAAGAVPALAWALAARIARDHRTELRFETVANGTDAIVRFDPA